MITRKVRLNSLLIQLNGGQGSGNPAPGQGRGIGKPGNGSLKKFVEKQMASTSNRQISLDYLREIGHSDEDIDKIKNLTDSHSSTRDLQEKADKELENLYSSKIAKDISNYNVSVCKAIEEKDLRDLKNIVEKIKTTNDSTEKYVLETDFKVIGEKYALFINDVYNNNFELPDKLETKIFRYDDSKERKNVESWTTDKDMKWYEEHEVYPNMNSTVEKMIDDNYLMLTSPSGFNNNYYGESECIFVKDKSVKNNCSNLVSNGGPGSGNPNPGQGQGIGKPGGGRVPLSQLENSYKGDYKKATSIWGKEYNELIKNFDTSKFTQDEVNMVLSYASEPTIGNSYEKNSYWSNEKLIERNDGKPLREGEYEEVMKKLQDADELLFSKPYEEFKKAEKKIQDEYTITERFPQHEKRILLFRDDIIDKKDFLVDANEYHKQCVDLIEKSKTGEVDYKKLDTARRFIDNYNHMKEYAHVYKDEIKEVENGKKQVINFLKYDTSDKNAKHVSYEYLSNLSDEKLDKLIERHQPNIINQFSTHSILKSEKDGRKLDKMINEKGISFDKDIVVTRRIQNESIMQTYEKKFGYYEQLGFTSTTAANNVAKSSGDLRFGNDILKIVLPAGTKVLPVEAFIKQKGKSDDRSLQDLSKQHEFLLPSKTKFISGDYENHRTFITMGGWSGDERPEFDESLRLDKIDTAHDYLYSYVAITPQYLEEHS